MKQTLPKDVAQAIDIAIEVGDVNYDILCGIFGNANSNHYNIMRKYVGKGGCTDFMNALVNGYEVEETPEDMVRKFFENYSKDELYHHGYQQAAKDILNILNIKIEGVNA